MNAKDDAINAVNLCLNVDAINRVQHVRGFLGFLEKSLPKRVLRLFRKKAFLEKKNPI